MIEKKIKRFKDSIKTHQLILFCVRCGSTNVGQESLSQLCCNDCDNTMEWDGLSFGVVQKSGRTKAMAVEAKKAFELRDQTPPWVEAADAQEQTNKANDGRFSKKEAEREAKKRLLASAGGQVGGQTVSA